MSKLYFKDFIDNRGHNMKFYVDDNAKESGFRGVSEIFATINDKGTVRAFHYQGKLQQKIIKPLAGSFNVRIVDTVDKTITEYNNFSLGSAPIIVKENQMLGYVSLEPNSIMVYIGDEYFDGDTNFGVNPMSYGVNWNTDLDLIMSPRDATAEVITEVYKVI